jgi:hypothetical protein
MFRRLPARAAGADDVEDMLLRVSALRGAGSVARPDVSRLLPRRFVSWQPVAAALAAAVLAGGHAPPLAPEPDLAPRFGAAQRALAAEISAQPLLEQLDQPYEHVVQWNADDLSVVLVVDERLDV